MIQTLKMVALAFAAIFVGAVVSVIPPLPAWFESVDAHRNEWAVIMGGAALVGLLVMMSGILWLVFTKGNPITHEEAEDVERSVRMAAKPVTWRAASYKVFGTAQGQAAEDEFSFRAMKEAWRSGAWRLDPVWRRRYLTTVGAALMAIGLFGGGFVLGPPPVKVLTGGALLYATGMISRGFWKA
ncbi:MAG: hypothetical protein HY208_05565 [Nitrospirae bacterium]|nr:hypothetical protein [Nitrospirota bacterium]